MHNSQYWTGGITYPGREVSFSIVLASPLLPPKPCHKILQVILLMAFFLCPPSLAPFGKPRLSLRHNRQVCLANINRTTDSSREDEIAAKIANLRKQKRLSSQRSPLQKGQTAQSDANRQSQQPSSRSTQSVPTTFDDLPDWKKEEILLNQMNEAETFFNRPTIDPSEVGKPSTSDNSTADEEQENYKPKVSTWGVFPRPDNISRTYGGGKRIRPGGVDLNNAEMAKRDQDVKEKLAAYRASLGIDVEKEEEHLEEIQVALAESEKLMKRNLPYEAITALEKITDFTSERSCVGGNVFLSLAFAYEAVGQRNNARDIYLKLRRSPFTDVSTKAKQLLQGFTAMEKLGVQDETESKGFRVTKFSLPDMNDITDKRYETAVIGSDTNEGSAEEISGKTNLMLLVVMLGPALILLALIASRR